MRETIDPTRRRAMRSAKKHVSAWMSQASLLTALFASGLLVPCASSAQALETANDNSGAANAPADIAGSGDDFWNLHAQGTVTDQFYPPFAAPYSGAMSLDPHRSSAETTDVTLYFGLRLWRGAGLFLDPELDQGFGLSNTTGLAGFSSGEAYKIGANLPYPRLQRAFVRQVIDLGGDAQELDDGPNQLKGNATANNLTLTVGKFSVVDIFDTNDYAHDPRHDFMNWSIIDAGAFDYAADSWGYTYGGALEWNQDFWTLRAGAFDLSTIPNGKQPDPGFGEFEAVIEGELRHEFWGHAAKLKLLLYVNRGSMASYSDALAYARETGSVPAVAPVRHFQSRAGAALNFQQDLGDSLGLFARASLAQANREAYEFTDIDQSVSGGVSLKGDRFGHPDDSAGLALVVNSIGRDARDYFSAGGLGILIGDGHLAFGPEEIAETYYQAALKKGVALTLDYQFVEHPAYNRERGPVSIFGIRLHGEI